MKLLLSLFWKQIDAPKRFTFGYQYLNIQPYGLSSIASFWDSEILSLSNLLILHAQNYNYVLNWDRFILFCPLNEFEILHCNLAVIEFVYFLLGDRKLIYFDGGGGARRSEDFDCVVTKFTWFPLKPCNILRICHWWP